MIDCGLQICSKGGCMYRADVELRIGFFLWMYRALLAEIQGPFCECTKLIC